MNSYEKADKQITFVEWLEKEVPDSKLVAQVTFDYTQNVNVEKTCEIYFYKSTAKERKSYLSQISDLDCINYDVINTGIRKDDWDGSYEKRNLGWIPLIVIPVILYIVFLFVVIRYPAWVSKYKKKKRNKLNSQIVVGLLCVCCLSISNYEVENAAEQGKQFTLLEKLQTIEQETLPEGIAEIRIAYQDGQVNITNYVYSGYEKTVSGYWDDVLDIDNQDIKTVTIDSIEMLQKLRNQIQNNMKQVSDMYPHLYKYIDSLEIGGADGLYLQVEQAEEDACEDEWDEFSSETFSEQNYTYFDLDLYEIPHWYVKNGFDYKEYTLNILRSLFRSIILILIIESLVIVWRERKKQKERNILKNYTGRNTDEEQWKVDET
jgi:hypothetical protein